MIDILARGVDELELDIDDVVESELPRPYLYLWPEDVVLEQFLDALVDGVDGKADFLGDAGERCSAIDLQQVQNDTIFFV